MTHVVLFVDMNNFFASCEQQDNYLLRRRPVVVCVYTSSPRGCVISPSIEARAYGIKTGMLLADAEQLCPTVIPLETHPTRYRAYHAKIMAILRQFSPDVTPKSIDEAVIHIKQPTITPQEAITIAERIKQTIKDEVGEYLRCSIGISTNTFLAKLASDLQKPDGLVVIAPDNIDQLLEKLSLTQLPGIGEQMAERLKKAGIATPLALRYASPERLRAACQSVIGWRWHLRLNFGPETETDTQRYQHMQAMRSVSGEQARSEQTLLRLLMSLCVTLEHRMVNQALYCQRVSYYVRYWNGDKFGDELELGDPAQDGLSLYEIILKRIRAYEQAFDEVVLMNRDVRQIGVGISKLVEEHQRPYSLFSNSERKDSLRRVMYALKAKYGDDKILRAAELNDAYVLKDLIGFGNIRDKPAT